MVRPITMTLMRRSCSEIADKVSSQMEGVHAEGQKRQAVIREIGSQAVYRATLRRN